MMWTMLIGRGRELRRLSALVAAAVGGRAGALLLVGEAGIGKSALLDGVRSRARKRGMRLLELRCVESEAVIEGGGLADLVGALRDRLAALVAS